MYHPCARPDLCVRADPAAIWSDTAVDWLGTARSRRDYSETSAMVHPARGRPMSDQHRPVSGDYRIALRPDECGADPFDHRTSLDDIVVRDVFMFRAEQMNDGLWWACCYLDGNDRIAWNISAKCRPRRLDWTGYEWPAADVTYEHDRPVSGADQ